jgi:hypothetical protein
VITAKPDARVRCASRFLAAAAIAKNRVMFTAIYFFDKRLAPRTLRTLKTMAVK